jgi:hypothetical protein
MRLGDAQLSFQRPRRSVGLPSWTVSNTSLYHCGRAAELVDAPTRAAVAAVQSGDPG